ncbi:hypothetical protein CUMW_176100 [Citrus unshiu]|uniref:Uncharacterized protein n=1 Tax=Citrus unshiu TaxID=55188 RepID=A0A2H5PXF7_CITUN|nr:hypothetical protein CUMW_176100 [Citrus unshiu]
MSKATTLMGITPDRDTRASTGMSFRIVDMIHSSMICKEYDSATRRVASNFLPLQTFGTFSRMHHNDLRHDLSVSQICQAQV